MAVSRYRYVVIVAEARSYLEEMSWKNRLAASASKGMYPTTSITIREQNT